MKDYCDSYDPSCCNLDSDEPYCNEFKKELTLEYDGIIYLGCNKCLECIKAGIKFWDITLC